MIYLIPGRNKTLQESKLAQAILHHDIMGREIVDDFARYPISKQVELIATDIKNHFWTKDAKLIGHSYGAYLLMHALLELLDFPGKVLLISPVLGAAVSNNGGSRPPRAKKIAQYAEAGKLQDLNIEAHTGELDNGCDPKLAQAIFSHMPKSSLTIVQQATHTLPAEYINRVLSSSL